MKLLLANGADVSLTAKRSETVRLLDDFTASLLSAAHIVVGLGPSLSCIKR